MPGDLAPGLFVAVAWLTAAGFVVAGFATVARLIIELGRLRSSHASGSEGLQSLEEPARRVAVVVPIYSEPKHLIAACVRTMVDCFDDALLIIATTRSEEAQLERLRLDPRTLIAALLEGKGIVELQQASNGVLTSVELCELRRTANATHSPRDRARHVEDRVRRLLIQHRTSADHAREITSQINAKSGWDHVVVVEDDSGVAGRSAQINRAIAFLAEEERSGLRGLTRVGIYDIDSIPAPNTRFEATAEDCEWCPAGQQPSLYLANMDRFAGAGLRASIFVAEALMQTSWALGNELPNWRRNHSGGLRLRGLLPRRPSYGTGHGMWFDLAYLRRIGGIPVDASAGGMEIGYLLSSVGSPLSPMRSFDVCEVPADPSSLARQSARWFAGAWEVTKLAGRAGRRWRLRVRENIGLGSTEELRRDARRAVAMVVAESAVNVRWAVSLPAFVLLVGSGMLNANGWILCSALVGLALNSVVPGLVVLRRIDVLEVAAGQAFSVPRLPTHQLVFGFCIRALIRGSAPFIQLLGSAKRLAGSRGNASKVLR